MTFVYLYLLIFQIQKPTQTQSLRLLLSQQMPNNNQISEPHCFHCGGPKSYRSAILEHLESVGALGSTAVETTEVCGIYDVDKTSRILRLLFRHGMVERRQATKQEHPIPGNKPYLYFKKGKQDVHNHCP